MPSRLAALGPTNHEPQIGPAGGTAPDGQATQLSAAAHVPDAQRGVAFQHGQALAVRRKRRLHRHVALDPDLTQFLARGHIPQLENGTGIQVAARSAPECPAPVGQDLAIGRNRHLDVVVVQYPE